MTSMERTRSVTIKHSSQSKIKLLKVFLFLFSLSGIHVYYKRRFI